MDLKTKQEKRIELLKAMHTVMIHMNDENAYMEWIEVAVPDEPQEEDFEFIAENDDDYQEITKNFEMIIKRYIKYGLAV